MLFQLLVLKLKVSRSLKAAAAISSHLLANKVQNHKVFGLFLPFEVLAPHMDILLIHEWLDSADCAQKDAMKGQ